MLNKLRTKFIAWLLKDLYALQATQLGYLIGNSQKLSNIQVSYNRERRKGITDKLDNIEKLEEYLFRNLPPPRKEDKEKWV